MFDLKLTESGDFLLSDSESSYGTFKLSFRQVEIGGLRISFLVSPVQQAKVEATPFKISFDTCSGFEDTSPSTYVETVKDDEYIYQKLRIALSTVLGDIENRQTVGSRIVEVKHLDLTSEINLACIQRDKGVNA